MINIDSWAEWADCILAWVLGLALLAGFIAGCVAISSIDVQLIFVRLVNFVDSTVGMRNVVVGIIALPTFVVVAVSFFLAIDSVIYWLDSVDERRVIASWRAGVPRPFTKQTILYLAGERTFRRSAVGVGDVMGREIDPWNSGPVWEAPAWQKVDGLMEAWLERLNALMAVEKPGVTVISCLMDDLYRIHPLRDGNKRLVRKVLTIVTERYGYRVIYDWTPPDLYTRTSGWRSE